MKAKKVKYTVIVREVDGSQTWYTTRDREKMLDKVREVARAEKQYTVRREEL